MANRTPAAYYPGKPTAGPRTIRQLGLLEIVIGALALLLPFLAGAFVILGLGLFIVVNGIIRLFSAWKQSAWIQLILGVVEVGAGTLILFSPSTDFRLIAIILMVYFLITGFGMLAASRQAVLTEGAATPWIRIAGIVNVALGLLLLFGWPALSAVILGIFVGLSILSTGFAHWFQGKPSKA